MDKSYYQSRMDGMYKKFMPIIDEEVQRYISEALPLLVKRYAKERIEHYGLDVRTCEMIWKNIQILMEEKNRVSDPAGTDVPAG